MKKVKFAVCVFLLLFCLALGGELYQMYLDDFTDGVYYFSSARMNYDTDSDIQKKRDKITALSEKNNCRVFCVEKNLIGASSAEITVYTPDAATEAEVKKQLSIAPGEYKSLFSGVTTVYFKDFYEAPDDMYFYFFGAEESVWNIKQDYNLSFNSGTLKRESPQHIQWFLLLAWAIFGLVLLFLTWFDIQFQKKENFVLVSLGKPVSHIILKNIFKDVGFLVAAAAVLTLVLSPFTHIAYSINISLLLFGAFLLLNSLVYLTMFRYDMKMALSKSNFSTAVLSDCYVLKAISLIVTVAVLSANILIISENGALLNRREYVAGYSGYSFLNVVDKSTKNLSSAQMTKRDEFLYKVENEIMKKEYAENDMAFSDIVLSGRDLDYVVISENSAELLDGIKAVESIDFSKDYYILLPEGCENPQEKTETCKSMLEVTDKYSCEVLTYSENKSVFHFTQTSYSTVNFKATASPVIILLSSCDMPVSSYVSFLDAMFNITQEDIDYYKSKYKLEEKHMDIKVTNVAQRTEYAWAVLGRMTGLSAALSLFMLLLELLMIITIAKLEYITNSVELSLKKILGYSLLSRNKAMVLLNAFSVFIGVFTAVTVALLLKVGIWLLFLLVGLAIFVLECVTICYYSARLERTNVPKILKGGCL